MKQEFDLVIGQDGSIGAIYQDGLAEALGATTSEVRRASTVEWEQDPKFPHISGWVVRSVANPKLAICDSRMQLLVTEPDPEPAEVHLCYFQTREAALEAEVKFFWPLLNGEHTGVQI